MAEDDERCWCQCDNDYAPCTSDATQEDMLCDWCRERGHSASKQKGPSRNGCPGMYDPCPHLATQEDFLCDECRKRGCPVMSPKVKELIKESREQYGPEFGRSRGGL